LLYFSSVGVYGQPSQMTRGHRCLVRFVRHFNLYSTYTVQLLWGYIPSAATVTPYWSQPSVGTCTPAACEVHLPHRYSYSRVRFIQLLYSATTTGSVESMHFTWSHSVGILSTPQFCGYWDFATPGHSWVLHWLSYWRATCTWLFWEPLGPGSS
jgi:hypothetical protein